MRPAANGSALDPHDKIKSELRVEFGERLRKIEAVRAAESVEMRRAIHELRPSGATPASVGSAGSASAPHEAIRTAQQQWTERVSDDTFRRVCLLMLVGFFGCAACAQRSVPMRVDSSGEGLCTAVALS